MSSTRLRAAVLTVSALLLTSACAGSTASTAQGPASPSPSAAPSASATPSAAPCTPSGKGTKDLLLKPTITVPTTPPPVETTSVDIVCGTGEAAHVGSAVEVKYVGVLYADGKEFDASWNRGVDATYAFTIGSRVVAGFSLGADGMKVGGRREVIVPSKDGYQESGSGPIPGGATLIFVIDLVKLQ